VNLKTDPKNCGACNHDCFGGDCDTGACQPVTVASNQSYPRSIATDGTYVYWSGGASTTASYVSRSRVGDQDISKVLAPAESYASGVAITPHGVFWLSAGHLRTCDAPNCTNGASDAIATVMQSGCGSSASYAPSKQALYWSCGATYGYDDGTLWSLPNGATTPVAVGANPASPTAMTTDGVNLYWLNSSTYTNNDLNADGAVERMRLSDGSIASLDTLIRADLYSIAVGGGAVYFARNIILDATTTENGVVRLPLPNGVAGSSFPKFADASSVSAMVADDQYLYFSDTVGSSGYIARCPHSGCPTPEVVAPGLGVPVAMAQDAVSIYWVNLTGNIGSIQRLAK
jgi:hypothetical protein